uniref:Protein bicaudal C homolog 1-like n=1 Tax=Saccoglossus kowalevskii TaxID=10224 RepID=A0ABM0MY23_SACKO|nr:PREDICTED: protein bicaudal C homolog 1-like [Saccoglossus kowalevskii]
MECNIWAPLHDCKEIGWDRFFTSRTQSRMTSQRDPHIKVSGKIGNVASAKEKIMAVLDTKSNRVTLKMDVSYTDHSHVIGKGGNNIKKVMQHTGCHIHFPDSNRGNQAEKSNQVSIAGQPEGVEHARRKIRELLPLTVMFELPITGALQPVPDINAPTIQQIVQTYNVSVSFKQRPRMYITTAIVRGCVDNLVALKEATARLIEHLTGNVGTTVPVSMQLEIAPQHHLFMIGRSGVNIKQLMQQTGASVHFPDPNSSPRKSTVFISGSIDSVLLARDFLIGCLPLVLMFDMKEDVDIDQQKITQLMEQLDVFISIKPKPKQPSKSVIVKSVERNAGNMYRARQILLGMDTEMPISSLLVSSSSSPLSSTSTAPAISISDSLTSGLGLNSLNSLGLFGGSALNVNTTPSILGINGHISPLQSPQNSGTSSPNHWQPSSPNAPTGYPVTPIFVTQPLNPVLLAPGPTSYPTPSPPPGLTPLDNIQQLTQLSQLTEAFKQSSSSHQSSDSSYFNSQSAFDRVPTPDVGASSNQSNGSSPSRSPSSSPPTNVRLNPPVNNNVDICTMKSGCGYVDVLIPSSYNNQSLHSSGNSSSNAMTDLNSVLGVTTSPPTSKKQIVALLAGARNIPLHHGDRRSSESGDSDCSDKKAPGAEWSEREREQRELERNFMAGQLPMSFDYEYKKLMATKAMQKRPMVSEVRTPTDMWSGMGFSKSMPEAMIREIRKKNNIKHPYGGSTLDSTYQGTLPEESEMPPTSSSCWPAKSSSVAPGEYPVHRKKRPEYSLSSSNYMDGTSLPSPTKGLWSMAANTTSKPDLPDLFSKLGLGKYTDVFQQQEIDLQTFLTLTDIDLKELGITTFGARRKMLLAISDLNKNHRKPFLGNTSSILDQSPQQHSAGPCW